MHLTVDCLNLSSELVMTESLVGNGLTFLLQLWHVAGHRPLEAARQVLQAIEGTCKCVKIFAIFYKNPRAILTYTTVHKKPNFSLKHLEAKEINNHYLSYQTTLNSVYSPHFQWLFYS